ncbi:hypothetical protein F2P56_000367 [Juglans regia]|uniref:Protein kinase domain-containing protein n=2 Tax=Juglans regia TaxID=51240 RepID=A0A833YAN8_JUGRE|nr:probable inactive receptor kinase At2g26730 [Juglans regia]KAF5479557.1 hypothetical protein F2P56_000367 [Juglans regia]
MKSQDRTQMNRVSIWVIFFSFFLILHMTNSVEDEVKNSLIDFLSKLSNNNVDPGLNLLWNSTTDPCKDQWPGVFCDSRNASVTKLLLSTLNLNGSLDITSLCNTESLAASLNVLALDGNSIGGGIPAEISNCRQLTRLHLSGNQLSGSLPSSLAMLGNLKRLDISNNNFSGELPELSRISGLTMLLAQNNHLSGKIPKFDFSNFDVFNVSDNNFSGLIPDVGGRFSESSFLGNPELCGDPSPKNCSSLPQEADDKPKSPSTSKILMYSGYIVVALVCLGLIVFKLCKRKAREEEVDAKIKVVEVDDRIRRHGIISNEYKSGVSRSENMDTSYESTLVSSSLIVLESPVVNGLKFEDLLSAPAELLGRGKHGTLYKIIFENGMNLVVKRIKDWIISSNEFKQRMQRMDQVKHPNVLHALGYYCSKEEKLLVYEYQENGSLFRLLHGTHTSQKFDWANRLSVAASIAEALAFMHQELKEDGIAHGNLKSSNILLNGNMEPRISEYGLMVMDTQNGSSLPDSARTNNAFRAFKGDIYGLGVILLELLTGKLVQNNGVDLADWVLSVIREEWTVEVFDRSLISEGASEERMVNLLQVGIKCVNQTPDARPSINQVVVMINTIKDEEERSISFDV